MQNRQENGANARFSAVALKYRMQEDEAPKVVAKGKGHVARKIVALAEESDVPVIRDEKLAEALSQVEIQFPIPVEAFQAVAEIYAFLVELDEKYAQKIH